MPINLLSLQKIYLYFKIVKFKILNEKHFNKDFLDFMFLNLEKKSNLALAYAQLFF